jgi:ribosomal protein L31
VIKKVSRIHITTILSTIQIVIEVQSELHPMLQDPQKIEFNTIEDLKPNKQIMGTI